LSQLLAVFTNETFLDSTVESIKTVYSIYLRDKIFVMELEGHNDLLCTFNLTAVSPDRMKGTMLLHRKNDTNTLYTINSLNSIIRLSNDGELNKNYQVDWSPYKNSLVLTQYDNLTIYPIKIHSVITVK
jgi:hypothetical protein